MQLTVNDKINLLRTRSQIITKSDNLMSYVCLEKVMKYHEMNQLNGVNL